MALNPGKSQDVPAEVFVGDQFGQSFHDQRFVDRDGAGRHFGGVEADVFDDSFKNCVQPPGSDILGCLVHFKRQIGQLSYRALGKLQHPLAGLVFLKRAGSEEQDADTRGFAWAEVTAGGIALDEVDDRTMRSLLRLGLFLAGEILDLVGPIGGFNFQAAFSTGNLAGQNA